MAISPMALNHLSENQESLLSVPVKAHFNPLPIIGHIR